MTDCKCTKEATFDEINKTADKFDKAINGNGRPGLIATVAILSTHVEALNKSMPSLNDKIDSLIQYKAANEACKSGRWKTIQSVALYFGLFTTFAFSILNYIDSHQVSEIKQNTVVTDPATLEQAIREGKNIKMRGATVTKEYEKNYQEGIKEMNK